MVCVIVVTHNNGNTLRESLNSLLKSGCVNEVIIVDNASSDDTRQILSGFTKLDKVNVVYLCRNMGFTGGVTVGLRYCSYGNYFALFNPDAVATRDWLCRLLEVMEGDETIGMAQSLLIKPNGDIDSAGGFINGLGYPIEFKPNIDWRLLTRLKPYDVGYAKGAAVLIRRKAYEEVGGFDNRFFFYYDETDLSYRLRRYGYRVVVVPSSVVYHVGLGSKIPNKEYFVLYYMERNHLLFLWKNLRSRFAPALAWSLVGAIKEKGARRSIRVKALKDSLKLIIGKEVNEPFSYSA